MTADLVIYSGSNEDDTVAQQVAKHVGAILYPTNCSAVLVCQELLRSRMFFGRSHKPEGPRRAEQKVLLWGLAAVLLSTPSLSNVELFVADRQTVQGLNVGYVAPFANSYCAGVLVCVCCSSACVGDKSYAKGPRVQLLWFVKGRIRSTQQI